MTDIVERLRDLYATHPMMMEAADEIERLRCDKGHDARAPRSLIEFARWVIYEGCFDGLNVDGGSIQDKATELGLLIKTKYDPAIHGENDDAAPGDDWYVLAPMLRLAYESTRDIADHSPEAK